MDRLRSALAALGAVLTGTGVLILLFVAYQLWGTGIYTARAQSDLKDDFREQIAESTTTTTAPATTATTAAEPAPPPPTGEAVAIIRIPRIGVDKAVVEGVSLSDLRKGPGHYPGTPLPGETGNAAIAGHRTTYGAPFNGLDELVAGDEIKVTTLAGTYTYKVDGKIIVKPNQVEVLDPTPEPRLTLTTCHPKYSASQRLVIKAALVPGKAPVAPPPPPTTTPIGQPAKNKPRAELADAGLASPHARTTTVLWGLVTALIGAGWWWGTRRRRHWTTWVGGAFPFLGALFVFYAHLERLLPANF